MSGAATAWRPIETAPKDGTEVLVWADDWSDAPVIARWRRRRELWFDTSFDSPNAHPYGHMEPGPTHWMPLPDPPDSAVQPTPEAP